MRYLIAFSLAALLTAGCAHTHDASMPHADFGEPTSLEGTTVSIGDVLDNTEEYDGKYMRLRGEVVGVCAKKGCWMRIAESADSADSVFVKFNCPISGHLIPMEAMGKEAVVEGSLTVEVVSEEEARHMAEDAGKTPEEIAEIKGETIRLRVASPGARVFGIDSSMVTASDEAAATEPAHE